LAPSSNRSGNLNPHSTVSVTASETSIVRTGKQIIYVPLSTANAERFAAAIELELKDEKSFNFDKKVLPDSSASSRGRTRYNYRESVGSSKKDC